MPSTKARALGISSGEDSPGFPEKALASAFFAGAELHALSFSHDRATGSASFTPNRGYRLCGPEGDCDLGFCPISVPLRNPQRESGAAVVR